MAGQASRQTKRGWKDKRSMKPKRSMKHKRVFLDRIEGKTAVLVSADADSTEQQVAAKSLPPEAKEGDWLICHTQRGKRTTYEVDQVTTEVIEQRVQSLMDELTQAQTQAE